MWTIAASAQTSASPAQVWAIYTDFANWPAWDKGLTLYRPDGPFAMGTNGTLQPTGGPDLPFELIQVEQERCFVDRTPIGPDAAIIGRHTLVPYDGGAQITHTIEIDGPDADHLAQEFGFKQAELQETVDSLARYAEGIRLT